MNCTRDEKAPIQDHCGIVAAFCPGDTEFFERGLSGLRLLQTRGYDGAGFCAQDTKGIVYQHKGVGMVNEVFTPEVSKEFEHTRAHVWVYQVRYGTSGSFDPGNVQPLVVRDEQTRQQYIIAHNGQFSKDPGKGDATESDTVLFAAELAERKTSSDVDQQIVQAIGKKRGAWSLVIGAKDALYVARDPFGFRPLVYGHIVDSASGSYIWAAASETSSLEKMGAVDIFELLPGTVAKITERGLHVLYRHTQRKRALCVFENIYIHHGEGKAFLPRSTARKVKLSPTIDDVRRRCGKILAREAPLTREDVDMVIGVPGTGIEGGMLYARALNLPYFQAITDRANPLDEQRTFMTALVDSIYHKVLDHFNFDAQALAGRRVVLVDDSIVRGNITKGLVYLLKHKYNVPAVHLRVLSPPVDKACHLGVNTRTSEELIAARCHGDISKIQKELNADSLAYLTAPGLREALTGDSKSTGFCMGCMAGHKAPIDEFGEPVKHIKPLPGKEPAVISYENVPISYPVIR